MTAVFKAISDPTRRDILAALSRRPMAVHDIAKGHTMSRPAISKHLAIMREAGLIERRQNGRENVYFLQTEPLLDVKHWLEQFWMKKISKLKDMSERDTL